MLRVDFSTTVNGYDLGDSAKPGVRACIGFAEYGPAVNKFAAAHGQKITKLQEHSLSLRRAREGQVSVMQKPIRRAKSLAI